MKKNNAKTTDEYYEECKKLGRSNVELSFILIAKYICEKTNAISFKDISNNHVYYPNEDVWYKTGAER
jgi:phosphosulfolactate synthase (CoM biosynthesis protein A)